LRFEAKKKQKEKGSGSPSRVFIYHRGGMPFLKSRGEKGACREKRGGGIFPRKDNGTGMVRANTYLLGGAGWKGCGVTGGGMREKLGVVGWRVQVRVKRGSRSKSIGMRIGNKANEGGGERSPKKGLAHQK